MTSFIDFREYLPGITFIIFFVFLFYPLVFYTSRILIRKVDKWKKKENDKPISGHQTPPVILQTSPPLFASALTDLLDSGIESSIGTCFRVRIKVDLNTMVEEHIMLSMHNCVLVLANWQVISIDQGGYKNYLQKYYHEYQPITLEETTEKFHECCTDLASHLVMVKNGRGL